MTGSRPDHLKNLNPEQHRAVTTLDGPLLILAGAGSGKTRVLTRRIAHLLHTGVDPRQILAVTFTNKAASEMKERVDELVGEAAQRTWVSTFHSTCCRILRMDIEALGYTRRFAIYDDEDQLRLIRDLLKTAGYDRDRVDPRATRSQIDHYKNRMMSVDDVLAQKRHHVNSPLVLCWRQYEEALQAADALDFNDLIGKTVALFREHPAVLSKWRTRFQYVMVDEYQDTNRQQYELLQLLVSEHGNLAVVGDDDQSIYGFRGADVSIILSFERDHPDATVVRLEQNYRSSANILAVANSVVAKNTGRLEKELWTQAPSGPRVQVLLAATPRDEAKRVARMIQTLRRSGHRLGDIAVVYRTNATSRPLEQAFRTARIAHRIVGGRKFYARREIRDALAYLRLIVNAADDAAFLRVVNVPRRGIGAKSLARLRDEAASRGSPLLATARAGQVAKGNEGLRTFVALIDELAESARNLSAAELVTQVIDQSGYRAMLEVDVTAKDEITVDSRARLANLAELVHDADGFQPPEGVWTPMDQLTAWLDRIKLTADSDEIPEGGEVTLMTVHSAKGLEYPVVFVVQMNEGAFPHARSEENGIDEERRLAYVAFTRAMKRLVIMRTQRVQELGGGRSREREARASRFLYGLPADATAGDVPEGDPAEERSDPRQLDEPARSKLEAFLSHRTTPREPDGDWMFLDVQSVEELEPGVRIRLPAVGVCEILARSGSRVQVVLPNRRSRWVDLTTVECKRAVPR